MMTKALIALGFSILTAGVAAAEVAVVSGGRVRLEGMGAFDQACHSLGPMSVSILQAPGSGTVAVERTVGYPNFPSFNTRSRCNTTRLPETYLFYQSTPGFFGSDTVSAEWIAPTGGIIRRFYRISVRPGVIWPPMVGEAPYHVRRHSRRMAAASPRRAAIEAPHHARTILRRSPRRPQPAPLATGKIDT